MRSNGTPLRRLICLGVLGGRPAVNPVRNRGVSEKAGHEAADQHPVRPGVEGLRGPGGLHPGGRRLPHAHGAASGDGAQSQASPLGVPARERGRAPSPRPRLGLRLHRVLRSASPDVL